MFLVAVGAVEIRDSRRQARTFARLHGRSTCLATRCDVFAGRRASRYKRDRASLIFKAIHRREGKVGCDGLDSGDGTAARDVGAGHADILLMREEGMLTGVQMNEAGNTLPRHLTLTMEHRGNASSAMLCCDDEENALRPCDAYLLAG
jgi:hypothetical protein